MAQVGDTHELHAPAFFRAAKVPNWLLGMLLSVSPAPHNMGGTSLQPHVQRTPGLPSGMGISVWPVVHCTQGLLVMFSGHIKAPQEDVGIAQVAVGPPLSCLVSKLLGDGQALQTDTSPEMITKP